MSKKYRLFILSAGIYGFIGLLILVVKSDLVSYFGINPFFVITFGILLTFTAFVSVLYVYLQGGFSNPKESANDVDEATVKKFLGEFADDFIKKLEKTENVKIDDEQIKAIIASRVESISNNTIWEKIEQRYGGDLSNSSKLKLIQNDLENVKYRLEQETLRLSRNSNINLSIGSLTTFLAIFFLAYSLLGLQNHEINLTTFLITFIPRFSLSLFIELFSFFFLRLYKTNLEDIKFFNNEKTNVDLKLISLKTALVNGDNDLIKSVVNEFSKTERNFVLKKGESTIDIERSKTDNTVYSKAVESLMSIFNRK